MQLNQKIRWTYYKGYTVYTTRSAPISTTQMVPDSELCDNDFIKEALDTVGNLNNIALDKKLTLWETSNGAPSWP